MCVPAMPRPNALLAGLWFHMNGFNLSQQSGERGALAECGHDCCP